MRLKEAFSFVYKVKFNENLFENEFDHVFIGKFNGEPNPNQDEVSEWKWVELEKLKKDTKKS